MVDGRRAILSKKIETKGSIFFSRQQGMVVPKDVHGRASLKSVINWLQKLGTVMPKGMHGRATLYPLRNFHPALGTVILHLGVGISLQYLEIFLAF